MTATTTPADAVWLPGPKVEERYQRTSMTIHRWLNNPSLNFPRPTYFGRYRYWKVADLERWEEAQARKANGRFSRAAEAGAEGGAA